MNCLKWQDDNNGLVKIRSKIRKDVDFGYLGSS